MMVLLAAMLATMQPEEAVSTNSPNEPDSAQTTIVEEKHSLHILPRGSKIELMVLREIDSNKALPGDAVKLMVNRSVELADGTLVIAKGARARGIVTETHKSGLSLARGKIAVSLTEIQADGFVIPLDGDISMKGKGGKSDDVVKVLMVPIYSIFAPGNSAKLKAGELLYATSAMDVCFATGEEGAQWVQCPTAPAPAESSGPDINGESASGVQLSSDGGAED